MGKASREHRQAVIAGKEAAIGSKKESALQIVKQAIFGKISDTNNAMVADVRNHLGQEVIKGCVKLVKEDIRHGKVKDVEQYVKDSMASVQKPKAMAMLRNGNVSLEEMEAVIRQTLKENYAGKV